MGGEHGRRVVACRTVLMVEPTDFTSMGKRQFQFSSRCQSVDLVILFMNDKVWYRGYSPASSSLAVRLRPQPGRLEGMLRQAPD